jgi:hypothetical protein
VRTEIPLARATRVGRPDASAPIAAAKIAARLYTEKMWTRRDCCTWPATSACSVGRNTLTSPDDGLRVPTTATTSSGQNVVKPANPRPVPTITTVAAMSSVRSSMRCAVIPKAMVSAAEPRRVPVTIAPTSTGEKPRWVR